MTEHYMTWKSEFDHWIALWTSAADHLRELEDETETHHVLNVLVDMAVRARTTQNWVECREYFKNKIHCFCMRYDQANAGYLEKIINCINGYTPMPQHLSELLKHRVESWRPIFLSTAESDLERVIQTGIGQMFSMRRYFRGQLGRRSEERCSPCSPRNNYHTY
ncbi:uncharacterized protein LOC127864855 [Dreissena polymorpha]|uniref:Uncharacterized protein n=1 Tax=Dreissena polymorpha TaxID=45954 RepID=A0A9D4NQV7_DREPO|nr:uncharacterized protein LOC127864855 [Dreissena polymorpha]KAH3898542.1 hypothetical protein DPMN_022777 [Dreissena polymorpha]